MNALVIILIIFVILIILGIAGFLIWYFAIRKKNTPSGGNGTGQSGTTGTNNGPGTDPGQTGPNAVSYLVHSSTYNPNDIVQFDTIQGTNNMPMGSIVGGTWTAAQPGTYLIHSDVSNNGGAATINLLKNKAIIGQAYETGFSAHVTTSTMGFANLVPQDTIELQTVLQLSITDPDPLTNATSHLILQRTNPNTSILYLTSGGDFAANGIITFNVPQQSPDPIGTMSTTNVGVWSPTSSGSYLIFADGTNDGGSASIAIVSSNSTNFVGSGFKSIVGSQRNITAYTMGYVTLSSTDTLEIRTPNGMNITTPNPTTSATSHFMIQKVDPSTVVSFIFSSTQPNQPAGTILKFSQLQGSTMDPLGQIQTNGQWRCNTPGKYLIYTDCTNDGGSVNLQLYAANVIIGTAWSADQEGTGTVMTMGYAQLNTNDTVYVVTVDQVNITNPDPLTFATAHLIIQKIL